MDAFLLEEINLLEYYTPTCIMLHFTIYTYIILTTRCFTFFFYIEVFCPQIYLKYKLIRLSSKRKRDGELSVSHSYDHEVVIG